MRNALRFVLLGLGTLLAFITAPLYAEGDDIPPNVVYTETNAPEGNEILTFDVTSDGTLTATGRYTTGGIGNGASLGNQGGVILSNNGRYLFAVNAASNDISVFATANHGLRLLDRVASGGTTPVSLTIHRDRFFVVKSGTDNIAGFVVTETGQLAPLPNSTRNLSETGTSPAQIQFSPDGKTLLVTEKATNNLDLFTLDELGLPSEASVVPSAGPLPWGLAFRNNSRQLLITEATNSTVSSYWLSRTGELKLLSGSLPTGQGATCWVVITPNGRFAYVTNPGTNSISALRIGAGGKLSLIDPDGVSVETPAPFDLALTPDGKNLFVLNFNNDAISGFKIQPDGTLTPNGSVHGIPNGANGLAVH